MATKGILITGHEVFPFRKRRDFTPKLPLRVKEFPVERDPSLTPVKTAPVTAQKKEVSFKEPEKKVLTPLTPVATTLRTPLRNITPKKIATTTPLKENAKEANVPAKPKLAKPRQDTPRKPPSPSLVSTAPALPPATPKAVESLEERVRLLELRLATVESRLNAGAF